MWKSQLQTEIKLSSTETEHTGLSYALREAIPLMHLLDEVKVQGIETGETSTIVKCHVLEDNGSTLKMAKVYKFHPHTEHLNVKFHHFYSHMEHGDISIHPIASKDQLANYLTKPLTWVLLSVLHKGIMDC